MALKKKATTKETESTTTDNTPVEAPVETPKEVSPARAAAPPAKAADTSAGVFIQIPALQELAADTEYGDFPSIVATNGTHTMKGPNGKVDLGKTIEFQAIGANRVWKVSTGDTSEAAKEFFKVSLDGDVCTDGTPLQDALEDAIEAGYSKSRISEGLDVIILIRKCEADATQEGELRVLQLAPSSMYNWRPLEKNVKGKAALGMLKAVPVVEGGEDLAVMFRSNAVVSTGEHDYTYFTFELV